MTEDNNKIIYLPASEAEVAAAEPVETEFKTIIFREQEVTLKYPLLAIARLEQKGIKLNDLDLSEDNFSVTTLANLVWAGLCLQFPDVTVDEVLSSYDLADLGRLGSAFSAAFNRAVK